MIIYREWKQRNSHREITRFWRGWFLAGIVPLYLECREATLS